MSNVETVQIIAVDWDGPFDYEDIVYKKYEGYGDPLQDRGLYQIYCNQNEPNTLMYVGRTESSFSGRIAEKQNWLYWESSQARVYLGRVINISDPTDYKLMLARAELLLIYYCSPPINKHEKMAFQKVRDEPNTIIINYRRRFRIPYVISNLPEKPPLYDGVGGNLGEEIEGLEDDDPTQVL